MKEKNSTKASEVSSEEKKSLVLIVVCLLLVFTAAAIGFFQKNNVQSTSIEEPEIKTIQTEAENTIKLSEGESLIIPISSISEEVSFFTIELDGVLMEIIAVRDEKGDIRTAFNTCQVCYSSGRGYYALRDDVLVCQNCGSRFSIDQIEIEMGGCNPWPILTENKILNEDSLEISYEFLDSMKDIFKYWKKYV